jgi:hypothetical protein
MSIVTTTAIAKAILQTRFDDPHGYHVRLHLDTDILSEG